MVEEKTRKLENIDILNDACFKSLFRSVEARGMFSRFLSAVTGIDKEALLNAEYTGGDIIKSKLTERGKTADIIVKVDSARQIVVEMNKFDPGNIFEKNASYAFSLFNENTKIGKRMWPQIILINIDNFNRFGTDLPILDFKIRDKTGEYEVDIFHSYNIVLANLKNPNYNIDKEVTKYLEFITSKEFSELKMIAEGDEDYMAAFRKVEDLSTDPNFIGYYDYEQAHQDDIEMAEYTGMKKGLEQGIEQGIEQTKREMILSMKEKGLSLEMIADISQISVEEVEKIINN